MMDCPVENRNGAEIVIAYVAGTLDAETSIAFERHMAVCGKCREMTEAQRSVWCALDDWTPAAISPDFDEKLYQRIALEERAGWWQRLVGANWSWRPAMPVAAACAILIAVFILKNPWSSPRPEPQPQPQLQIEQIEHALDDLDMLKQVGIEAPANKTPTSEEL